MGFLRLGRLSSRFGKALFFLHHAGLLWLCQRGAVYVDLRAHRADVQELLGCPAGRS